MMAKIIMERNVVFNGGVDVEEVVELLLHTHHSLASTSTIEGSMHNAHLAVR